MNLFSKKNFLLILAAVLVVGFAVMALSTRRPMIESPRTYDSELTQIDTQSNSDELETIESDLNDTDFDAIDEELNSLESEFN